MPLVLPVRTRAAYAALAFFFAIVAIYRVLEFRERLGDLLYGQVHVREPFDIDLPEFRLVSVMPEAAAAGLQEGDVVRRIDGRVVHPLAADLWVPLRRASAGDRLVVGYWRPGTPETDVRTGDVILAPLHDGAPSVAEWVGFAVFNVGFPLFCTVLGFWVAAARPSDSRAWLLLLLVLSLAEFTGGYFRFLGGSESWFQPIAAAYQPLLANMWPTAMLFFAITFPERLGFDRRWPWLKWVAIVPIVVRVVGLNPVYDYVARRNPAGALRLQESLAWTEVYFGTSYPLFILLFLVIMGYRAYTERQPDARRRLLLLLSGVGLSVAPLAGFLIALAFGARDLPEWAYFVIVGPLLLFPLTMAYVIVVHRAMDVRVVVRQGLQYLLARGSLRALQLVVSSAALAGAIVFASRTASFVGAAVFMAVGLLIVVLIRRFSDTLQQRVDRRFFREAYDADQILSELADKVRTMIETKPLLETITLRIAEALHVPRVAILLNEGGQLVPAYAVGFHEMPAMSIPADSWAQPDGDAERRVRSQLESELLLPLALNQKLVGVMSLGAKRSEEPYSPSDLRLLGSVATQAGLALENSRLNAQITLEITEREKRRRELEIAREVQERLFPQSYPPVQGLELAGACRPALAIGGDYYDFVPLAGGRLGIAIGDISGKGIPAALLMATLRAFLRGQTVRGQGDLAGLIADLSGLVYESSAPNRYATFFYAEYDPALRRLVYVNAGHNPPMLLRGGGDGEAPVERLDAGGPVIGLLPECVYTQAEVQIAPGDLLVAFTDGVSEAMNAVQEEWGEERLLPVLQGARGEPLPAVIERVMAAADAYVAGAPQHDDMTIVVVRCT
jgi:sigma-B regulation protein RsbU (phosphoserine phosphatase)